MVKKWQVVQTPSFKRAVKKLAARDKADLDAVVKKLAANPQMGEKKKGDLAFLRVVKFHMGKQPMLLGYSLEEDRLLLVLLALGPHENFYRNVKGG